MKIEDIKRMLKAYYEGNISSSDEQLLLDYFSGDNISPELADEGFIFVQIHQGDKVDTPSELQEKIQSLIDNLQKSENIKPQSVAQKGKNKIVIWAVTTAACAIVLLSTILILNKPQETIQPYYNHLEDTHSKPEDACIEAQKALLLVSRNLNKGLNRLELANQDVGKMSEIVNNSFNSIKR